MKNKKILFILIPILFLTILIILFLVQKLSPTSIAQNGYRNELNNNKKRLLVEYSYQNFAWGWYYQGTAIFNDGCIYTWDNSDFESSCPDETNADLSEWILTYGTKQELKVTEEDLSKIEVNLSTLKDELTYPDDNIPMYDAGSTYISTWNGDSNFILSSSGDNFCENITQESQTIRSIVKPYFDKLEK